MADIRREIKHLFLLTLIGITLMGIIMSCSPTKVENINDPIPIDSLFTRWHEPIHPDSVVSNFFYLYDFKENGLDVEVAIDSYRVCFVENDQGYQYEFKYWMDGGTTVDYMTYAEEMMATANMFRKIANEGLYFDMVNFSQLKHFVEVAEDSSQHVHPGEDWHVYRMAVTFYIDNPNGGIMFKVAGDIELYIRKCSDGYYRVVRWIDYTHEGVGSGKVKKMMSSSPLIQSSWGQIKNLYR